MPKTDPTVTRPVASRPEPMRTHTVRCGSEWDEAAEVAKAEGLMVSEVIRHYLREYVAGANHKPRPEAVLRAIKAKA